MFAPKHAVMLTKATEKKTDTAEAGKAAAAPAKAAAPAAAPEAAAAPAAPAAAPAVHYRRYHNWNTPVTVQSLGKAASLDACEASCTADKSCFGVTYDASVQSCVSIPPDNFDADKGLKGRFTSGNITASLRDNSLTSAPMDCYGPFKIEEPHRVGPSQCPRSREAAINAYFADAKPLAVFGNMLSRNPTKERYE